MDPNVAWKTAVTAAEHWIEAQDLDSSDGEHEIAADLANAVADLAEWLDKGGFPPQSWSKNDDGIYQ